jgi:hypothetical protein
VNQRIAHVVTLASVGAQAGGAAAIEARVIGPTESAATKTATPTRRNHAALCRDEMSDAAIVLASYRIGTFPPAGIVLETGRH